MHFLSRKGADSVSAPPFFTLNKFKPQIYDIINIPTKRSNYE